ncbi:MAG: hypothetical protein HFH73_10690 [Lachnospiraceae bacterium]|nr:hypothetical protein [Lachnospiraceae bacterium]
MAEELFKKKISKEEKLYQEAVNLQKAVSCVLRFERKVNALNSAAKKFESLGDYRDAKIRMKACREEAAAVDTRGAKETFALALNKKEAAKRKSDYVDAIEEFKRLRRRDEYRDKAKEQIQICKKQIARIESRAAWIRRFTILAVFAVIILIFLKTPGYPFAKGFIYQQMGEYEAALVNYRKASVIPWTKDLNASCHYKIGLEQLEKGEKEKAYVHFNKAKKLKAARKRAKELERELSIE